MLKTGRWNLHPLPNERAENFSVQIRGVKGVMCAEAVFSQFEGLVRILIVKRLFFIGFTLVSALLCVLTVGLWAPRYVARFSILRFSVYSEQGELIAEKPWPAPES